MAPVKVFASIIAQDHIARLKALETAGDRYKRFLCLVRDKFCCTRLDIEWPFLLSLWRVRRPWFQVTNKLLFRVLIALCMLCLFCVLLSTWHWAVQKNCYCNVIFKWKKRLATSTGQACLVELPAATNEEALKDISWDCFHVGPLLDRISNACYWHINNVPDPMQWMQTVNHTQEIARGIFVP